MAARLRCRLDPSRNILHLRPVGPQSSGRSISRSSRLSPLPAAAALRSFHRSHVPLRSLPSCAWSPAGPCVLRFTCADLRRCMGAPMNFARWHGRRMRGLTVGTLNRWQDFYHGLFMQLWEDQGWSERLCTYVLGGCRHKLVPTL
ncbi:X protein [Tai Forest hepadnavirus]|uniref:X protein n=1 Tax=Tai Forest hepadnavirus TaxID=2557875 RepID=A0A482KHS7_9HEPA|nr:X protein [Tai Forest hepadnavirus]QBQ18421.1 X protein [Tai Forest hepadnavirus]